jgi:hypothetical protein
MSERPRGSIWLPVLAFVVVIAALFGVGAIVMATNTTTDELNRSFDINPLPPAPPPSEFGTHREIGTRGDDANPGALFHGGYPSDDTTQERHIGGLPARFSGYTAWVRSVTSVPAKQFVDGYSGRYLRARITVFNRDTATQHICGCDFSVWTRTGGLREADVVRGQTVSPDGDMKSGTRRDGDVYLYVGTVRGPYYVVFDPDQRVFGGGSAHGVWRVTS